METGTEINRIDLDSLENTVGTGTPIFSNSIELIKNVKVNLNVKLGNVEITVDELFTLKNGSVIKLEQELDAPVQLLLDDRVVAIGNLVVVEENFGVNITEIMHY